MSQLADELATALERILARYEKRPDEERIILAAELNNVLLKAQGRVARVRRQAVRSMRASGFTLVEIADKVGLSHQRISQIESGADRKEKG
jgi:DNA-directed RNA polymerase sigma subunit (sigma70/sigma32)